MAKIYTCVIVINFVCYSDSPMQFKRNINNTVENGKKHKKKLFLRTLMATGQMKLRKYQIRNEIHEAEMKSFMLMVKRGKKRHLKTGSQTQNERVCASKMTTESLNYFWGREWAREREESAKDIHFSCSIQTHNKWNLCIAAIAHREKCCKRQMKFSVFAS